MSNLPEDFVFSQSSLQDYIDCPRRFELRYLRRMRWPAVEAEPVQEHEARMAQGARFHHLIQQYIAGIPAEVLAKHIQDETLRGWWATFLATVAGTLPETRYAEMTLTVPLGDWLLAAKFDLLTLGERVLIYDWKTSRKLPRDQWLLERMQTLVYRYVLAAGGGPLNGGQAIPPERIGMLYWFAEHDGAVRTFPYSEAQFQADGERLRALVAEIDSRAEFPLTPDERKCAYCVYRSYCDRGESAGDLDDWDDDFEATDLDSFVLDLEQIAEIEF